jgi:hypothetical protein
VRLAEAEKFVDPASLVQRLESLAGLKSGGKKNDPPIEDGGPPAGEPQSRGPIRRPVQPQEDKGNQTASPRALSLSTEEKRQIQNDPVVKEMLSLFGGEIIDMRKQAPPAPEPPPVEEDNGRGL